MVGNCTPFLSYGPTAGSTCSLPISWNRSAYSRNAVAGPGGLIMASQPESSGRPSAPSHVEPVGAPPPPGPSLGAERQKPEDPVSRREAVARSGPQQVGALQRRIVRDVVVVR